MDLVSAAGFEPAVTESNTGALDQLGDAPTGFEPVIFTVNRCYPGPLDEGSGYGDKESEEDQKGDREKVETEIGKETAANATGIVGRCTA